MSIYKNSATVATGANTELAPATIGKKRFEIKNEGSGDVYLKFGSAASAGDYDRLLSAYEVYWDEFPSGSWQSVNARSASGSNRVTIIAS